MSGLKRIATSIRHVSRRDIPALMAGLIIGGPVMATVLIGLFAGGGDIWTHIFQTALMGYVLNTVALMIITGALVLIFAVPSAYLVTYYRFPGQSLFHWALILPLAAPGYVLAISYADFLGVSGPLQSGLRELTGLSAREYWFPDIRSLIGCSFVLACCLYPYAYLTLRVAFTSQSVSTLEAAKSLGLGARARFWRVILPSARPAIVAGTALALMEAVADYGAADYLGVQTLTVGVFRAWASYGDAAAGARLAILLVSLTLFLQWAERRQRGAASFDKSAKGWRKLTPIRLRGKQALGASFFCTGLLTLGFVIPMGHLIGLALEGSGASGSLLKAFWRSVSLAGLASLGAFALSLVIAFALQAGRTSGRFAQLGALMAYAIPGAVLALGALYVQRSFNLSGGPVIALGFLVLIYISRFTAAGLGPVHAALQRAPTSLTQAARSLGASRWRRFRAVEWGVIWPGAAASMLILFVEMLKELPATLLLRPFDWDTLAVRAYAYASDERLAAAALPSLAITLAGLLPVILLSRQLSKNTFEEEA